MSGNPKVYQENKPACANCSQPFEDSDAREQHAGKVYHKDQQACFDTYMNARYPRQEETMTTELEPRGNNLPSTREHDPYDAFQQATKDDLILPVRKLMQGVSRRGDVSKAGQFWDETMDSYKAELHVAIIWMNRERALFGGDLDSGPLCASDDAIGPRERTEVDGTFTGPNCEDCAFSKNGTGKDGKGQACQFSYRLLCHDLEDSSMFLLRVGGASRGDWKRYITRGQRQGTAAYSVTTIIGSEKRKYPKGSAFAVTFKAGSTLPEITVEIMRELVAEYQSGSYNEPEEVPFD